jgi:hypothetical protein
LAALIVVAIGGASGCGDDESSDADATTTVASGETSSSGPITTTGETTATTTAATTLPAGETCGGVEGLGEVLMTMANESSPQPGVEYMVSDLILAADDPTWGRGQVSAPPDLGIEGFIAIAQCRLDGDGVAAWSVIDAGTSGLGCIPDVPEDLRVGC